MKNNLSREDWEKWFNNLLLFTAPALALFFGQLAAGVDFKIALSVALFGLYGAIADLFKKYKAGE